MAILTAGTGLTYATLALAHAAASPGDTIQARGTFTERFVIQKSLTLEPYDASGFTIDAAGRNNAIRVDTGISNVTLRGFTAKNSLDTGISCGSTNDLGTGIVIEDVLVMDCGNAATSGNSGIGVFMASSIVRRTTVLRSGEHGIYIGADNCLVEFCYMAGNGRYGLRIYGDNSKYRHNEMVGNGASAGGFTLSTQIANKMDGNRILRNVMNTNYNRNVSWDATAGASFSSVDTMMLMNLLYNASGFNILRNQTGSVTHGLEACTHAWLPYANDVAGAAANTY